MSEEKREYNYKPVEELTFTDDFMFGAVMLSKIASMQFLKSSFCKQKLVT